jgi:hypothetical protein
MRDCALRGVLSIPLGLLLSLALLVLAGACSPADAPGGTPATAPEKTAVPFAAADPSASAPPSGAEEVIVPFVVCWSSRTWTRPSEEEQASKVWARPRYGAADVDKLRAQLYEDFFPYSGGNSELFDSWPLHGLWTAEDATAGDPACAEGGTVGREVISVFLLLHEVKEVRLSGNTYRIGVEATPTGFQEIQFANLVSPIAPRPEYPTTVSFRAWFRIWARASCMLPESPAEANPVPKEQPIDYNLVVVDTSGRELARAEGGIRFERLAEGSAVPTTTQAGVGPWTGP